VITVKIEKEGNYLGDVPEKEQGEKKPLFFFF
jgi:hypothetical protein